MFFIDYFSTEKTDTSKDASFGSHMNNFRSALAEVNASTAGLDTSAIRFQTDHSQVSLVTSKDWFGDRQQYLAQLQKGLFEEFAKTGSVTQASFDAVGQKMQAFTFAPKAG